MDLQEHKKQFEEIVKKYNLFEEKTAHKISQFLTKSSNQKIDAQEFAKLFNIKTKKKQKHF